MIAETLNNHELHIELLLGFLLVAGLAASAIVDSSPIADSSPVVQQCYNLGIGWMKTHLVKSQ